MAKPSRKTGKSPDRSDPTWIYEDTYTRLTAIMDNAPTGAGAELAVLDAVITAAAHFAADSFTERDAAPGVLKCVQLFAERMRETLVAEGEDLDDPEDFEDVEGHG
jgi:hypothetical protein